MNKSRQRNVKATYVVMTALMMAVALGVVYVVGPGVTGAAVLDTGAIISTNTTLELGESVTSMRVTGSVSGSGNVVLYLGNRIVVDTRTLNTSLENYCLDTCEVGSGVDTLRAVVDGDTLLVVTEFNYTVEESVSVPEESANETVVIMPVNETINGTNETNETSDIGQPNETTNETVGAQFDVFVQDFPSCTADTTNGRWTVSSATIITTNQTCYVIVVNNSATLTVNSNFTNYTLKIEATNITIANGSVISAVGLGFQGARTSNADGNGPGGGKGGFKGSGGGGHGGFGGNNSQGFGGVYGSISDPRTLGSGGGDINDQKAQSGGGAIFINVTDTFNNSGNVSVKGQNITGDVNAGGGAGGSILVHAATLTGTGQFNADGGAGSGATNVAGGGGGGRIAIYYDTYSFTGIISADGGLGGSAPLDKRGGAGTIFRKSRTSSFAELIVSTGNATSTPTILNNSLGFDNETTDIRIGPHASVNQSGLFTAINLRNLTILGGATLELLNQYSFNSTMNVLITGTGSSLTHKSNTDTHLYNITLTMNNLTITNGSSIHAIGQGYWGGQTPNGDGAGPGGGKGGFLGAGGGGHGGFGGNNSHGFGGVYGSISEPRTLGSGGGDINDQKAQSGGGAIFLNVTGTFNNSGNVTVKGRNISINGQSGGGSGGSILVHAATLIGTGQFNADGSAGSGATNVAGGGGGGRIAIYYDTYSFTGIISADGGLGGSAPLDKRGGAGTIFRKSRTTSFADLIIVTGNSTSTQTILNNSLGFDNETTDIMIGPNALVNQSGLFTAINLRNLTILSATFELTNKYQFNSTMNVLIAGAGSSLTHRDNNETHTFNLTLTMSSLIITNGSQINGIGKGYWGGLSSSDGFGPGGGKGTFTQRAGGAGHGGYGGNATNQGAAGGSAGGPAYGSITQPRDLGSGGGELNGQGSKDGGGAIFLNVTGTFNNSGNVSVRAENATLIASGGGAGGSIWVIAGTLTGNGQFNADGTDGTTSSCECGGGAGGRIALYYNVSTFTGSISVNRGGGPRPGDLGSLFICKTFGNINCPGSGNGVDLGFYFKINNSVNINRTIGSWSSRLISFNESSSNISNIGYYNFTGMATNTLFIIYNNSFNISTNKSDPFGTIAFNISLQSGTSELIVEEDPYATCTGDTLTGIWTISSATTITTNVTCKIITVNNSATLTVNSNFTNVTVYIEAVNITVASGSSISADGYGYQQNPTANGNGNGPGGGGGSNAYGGGAGHGGISGEGAGSCPCGLGGKAYGSIKDPRELGSSGGSDAVVGADGGGAIFINATTFFNNSGYVGVQGSNATNCGSAADLGGAGSGGSLLVHAGTLAGNGVFTAKGGNGCPQTSFNPGAGAGGRVALYYDTNNFVGVVKAQGGSAGMALSLAAGGTVFRKARTTSFADLVIDTDTASTSLYTPLNDSFGFDNDTTDILIKSNALINQTGPFTAKNLRNLTVMGVLQIGKGYVFNDTMNVLITGSGSLTTLRNNVTHDHNITITAHNFTVDSSAMIGLNGRGYRGGVASTETGSGPGGGVGASNYAGGASHGGYGGMGSGSGNGGARGAVYGSIKEPRELGSGGGADESSIVGSHGGGALFLNVTHTLNISGIINVEGINSTNCESAINQGGAGSGGSIFIHAVTIKGNGIITAKGGNGCAGGTYNAGAGGGGRIAIYYDTNNFVGVIKAHGGSSGRSQSVAAGGTMFRKARTSSFADLIIDTSIASTHIDTPINDSLGFDNETTDILIKSNALINQTGPFTAKNLRNLTVMGVLQIGKGYIFNDTMNVLITGSGSTLTHLRNNATHEHNITITAHNFTVDANGLINLDGRGYSGGIASTENGFGPGGGSGAWNYGGGGAHGGAGGAGGGSGAGGAGGKPYGSLTEPVDLGSGGGADENNIKGAHGGGALYLNISGTLNITGNIISDGMTAINCGSSTDIGGAGAGGSIRLYAATLIGNGTLNARGGAGCSQGFYAGGGGGGRISVSYNASTYVGRMDVTGGGGNGGGSLGSIFVCNTFGNISCPGNGNGVDLGFYFRINNSVNITRTIGSWSRFLISFNESSTNTSNIGFYNFTGMAASTNFRINNNSLTVRANTSDPSGTVAFNISLQSGTSELVVEENPYATCTGDTTNGIWTISSATTITTNVTCKIITVNNSATLTVNSNVTNVTVKIEATNITIAAGAKISADSLGYQGGRSASNGNGPGGGPGVTGSILRAGGAGYASYGGATVNAASGRPYGSIADPRDLGSGGGGADNDIGGGGGGAIFINATNIFNNSGFVTVLGGAGVESGDYSGGGAGGSILVHAQVLTGIGHFNASGGIGGSQAAGSGAGGRIAIYYNSNTFTGGIRAEGGTSSTANHIGGTGTIFMKSRNSSFAELVITGTAAGTKTTVLNNSFGFDNETTDIRIGANTIVNQSGLFTAINLRNLTIVDGGVFKLSNLYIFNTSMNVLITGTGSTLTHLSNNATHVYNITLTVQNLTIGPGASLGGSGAGFPGRSLASGAGPGGGGQCTGASCGAGGGGYGGAGGTGSNGNPGSLGPAYGSITQPRDLGSAGGAGDDSASDFGGAGGGAIYINVTDTFNNSGNVSVNGNKGTEVSDYGGGGSGGSIFIITKSFVGNGMFNASGGVGSGNRGASGAGGRIAIYYNTTSFTGVFGARGGSEIAANKGAAGTIFRKSLSSSFADLTIENDQETRRTTPLDNSFGFDNETTDIRIGANTIVNQSGPFTAINLRNLTITDGGVLRLSSFYILNTSVNVLIIGTGSVLTHAPNNATTHVYNVSLTVQNLTIGPGASLGATGAGFLGRSLASGAGPGGGGQCTGAGCGAGGGGYGGAGAKGTNGNPGSLGPAYGSIAQPRDLGSSGGAGDDSASDFGGAGGGAIYLNVLDTFNNSGNMSVNGLKGTEVSDYCGGGSGGSIFVITNSFVGNGIFNASGGIGSGGRGAAGGGGRIAIHYNISSFTGVYDASAGTVAPIGNAGTIFICNTFSNISCPGSGNGVDMSFYFKINNSVNINRTITSWSSSRVQWNDSSSNITNIGFYNFTGFTANTEYSIKNNSIQHALSTTSGDGTLTTFNISLNGDKQIIVSSNAVPTFTTPQIYPADIYAHSNLTTNTTYQDEDADTGQVEFRWYINNSNTLNFTQTLVASGALVTAYLNSGNLTRHDRINVSVYASDGTENSTPLFSTTVVVYNAKPEANGTIPNQTFAEDATPHINLRQYIVDPDQDVLTFNVSKQSSSNISYTFYSNGTVKITPNLNFNGFEWVIFGAADTPQNGTFISHNVSINVTSQFDSLSILQQFLSPDTLVRTTSISLDINISNIESTGNVTCNLTGDFNGTNTKASGLGVLLNYSLGTQEPGTYFYNATCYDEFNVTSRAFNFSVANASDPDLRVVAGSIIVSNDRPEVNETITVYGEVENLGQLTAENVNLAIKHNGVTICNSTVTVPGLESRASIPACNYAFTSSGVHILTIAADQDNVIRETDEGNNDAARSVLAGTVITAYIGMNTSINVTQGSGKGSYGISSIYTNDQFFVNGTVWYTSGREPAPGATVNIQFTGTNSVTSTKTLSYSSFTQQAFTSGSTSGNFTVNLTVTDGLLIGHANYSLEVLSRPTQESDPEQACPVSFPSANLYVESSNLGTVNCIESIACTLTFTIRNGGCPEINHTLILINETLAQTFNSTNAFTVGGEKANLTSISWTPPSAGTFTFVVDIDPRNNISESDENNRFTGQITALANKPDLIPTSYQKVPTTGPYRANQTETYELTIKNSAGAATSGEFTVDMRVNGAVVVQNTTSTVVPARSGSTNGETTVRFTHLLSDPTSYNITFVVDSSNTQTESIENNNNLSTTVTPVSAIDLEIQSISISNSTRVLLNRFVYFNTSFKNIGNKNVTDSNFNVTFYLQNETYLVINATNFSTALFDETLKVLNVSFNVTNATGGSVTIKACVDPEDVINESGWGGVNCQTLSFQVYNGTDARAQSIATTPSRSYHFIKEPITFNVTVSNEGTTAITNLDVGVNITSNGSSLVYQTTLTQTIDEFGGTTTFNFSYMPVQHGDIQFNVKVDHGDSIAESDETNNLVNKTIQVYYPDVRVTSSDITFNDSLPYINETVQVTVLIHDDSVFKASNVSVNFSTIGIQLNISNVTEIPAVSADSVRFNFTPNVSGVYVLRFQVWDNLTQHTHGNQNNDIASQSIYVRNAAPGQATSNLTVNYPNGNETVSGTISVSTYVYDEDGSTDGGVVRFYHTQDNVTYTLIGSTNTSTGDHFSIGGPGALYSVSWDTTSVPNGDYWLFSDAAIALSNNDSSDRPFTISNTGSTNNGGGGDDEEGGGGGGSIGGDGDGEECCGAPVEKKDDKKDDGFEAQPIKTVEVEFTNTGGETIRDLKIGVGMTPEEVEIVVYDLELIEKDLAKFASDVIDALNECENASDETVNEIQRQTLEIKNKFDTLKTNLLNAFKAGAITSQTEVDALNAQIQEVKDLFDTFNRTLRDSYESGKLCEISELFELNLLLTKIIDGFELLKADVLKALKVSVLGNAENYLPLYPNKAIRTCIGAFELTLLPVSDRLLTPQLLEPIVVDEIQPGETIKRNISIKLPITARTNISIDVVYSAYGQELDRETLTFNLTPKVAASAVYVGLDTVDLYAVVSELPGNLSTTNGSTVLVDQKQAPLPDALDPYIAEEITLEVVVIKNATDSYDPTLGMDGLLESVVNGPQTPFVEVLGPYPLKRGERVLLAQQFKYDPAFQGTYELEFNFRRGNEFVARQRHPLTLTCSGTQCNSICSVQGTVLLTRYLLIWMVVFVAMGVLVLVLLIRKRHVVLVVAQRAHYLVWERLLRTTGDEKHVPVQHFKEWDTLIGDEKRQSKIVLQKKNTFQTFEKLFDKEVQSLNARVLKPVKHNQFQAWERLMK